MKIRGYRKKRSRALLTFWTSNLKKKAKHQRFMNFLKMNPRGRGLY